MDSGKAGKLRQIPITPKLDRDLSVSWGRTGMPQEAQRNRRVGTVQGGPVGPNRQRVKSPEQQEYHTWGSSRLKCLSLDLSQ